MNSHIGTNKKGGKEERQVKNKIRVGSMVTAKAGEMEYKSRARRSRFLSKETLVYVQSMLGKKIFELVLIMGKIDR